MKTKIRRGTFKHTNEPLGTKLRTIIDFIKESRIKVITITITKHENYFLLDLIQRLNNEHPRKLTQSSSIEPWRLDLHCSSIRSSRLTD